MIELEPSDPLIVKVSILSIFVLTKQFNNFSSCLAYILFILLHSDHENFVGYSLMKLTEKKKLIKTQRVLFQTFLDKFLNIYTNGYKINNYFKCLLSWNTAKN